MRIIITITEYPSMPGRYKVCTDEKDRRGRRYPTRDVRGAGAAAAAALSFAQAIGSTGYQIFGPEQVMQGIPKDMQERA